MKRSPLPRKTPLKRGKKRLKRKKLLGCRSKNPRKVLMAACGSLHSKIIRARGDYRCVTCGVRNPEWSMTDPTSAECSHLFSAGGCKSVIFDLRPDGNCHVQCKRCNQEHGGVRGVFRVRVDQSTYFLWYIKTFGLDRFEELRAEAKQTKNWRIGELRELHEELTWELKRLGG